MPICGWRMWNKSICAILVICAGTTGCQSLPGRQPVQAKFFDNEHTIQRSAQSTSATSTLAAGSECKLETQGEFVVLPAVQPRGLERSNPAGAAPSQVQPAAFLQAEAAPQPKTLPEPNPKAVVGPPAAVPTTDAGSTNDNTAAASNGYPELGAPQPDTSGPKGIANRCRNCSLVKRWGLTMDVPVKNAPKEMHLVTSPKYIIQPPDIILVESPRSLPDQPIAGEHLVRADGTISLGLYGDVRVAGLTVDEAREAIQKHLSRDIRDPQVNVDVYSYNSTFYYIVYDGAGYGEAVVRVPFTGRETVLDAIAGIGGIPTVSSKRRIWIARPVPTSPKCAQILPVDWEAIVKCGETATNYQVFPGDRIYIQSDRLQALDGAIAKIVSPMERVLGLTLLTAFNLQRWQNLGRNPGLQQVGFATGPVVVANPGTP